MKRPRFSAVLYRPDSLPRCWGGKLFVEATVNAIKIWARVYAGENVSGERVFLAMRALIAFAELLKTR